jgi:hypothetical protein
MHLVTDILDNRRSGDIYDEKITNDDHHYYIGERGDKSVNTDDKESGFDRLATGVGSGDVADQERNIALNGRAMRCVVDKIQVDLYPLEVHVSIKGRGLVFLDGSEGPGADVDGGLDDDHVVVQGKFFIGPEEVDVVYNGDEWSSSVSPTWRAAAEKGEVRPEAAMAISAMTSFMSMGVAAQLRWRPTPRLIPASWLAWMTTTCGQGEGRGATGIVDDDDGWRSMFFEKN